MARLGFAVLVLLVVAALASLSATASAGAADFSGVDAMAAAARPRTCDRTLEECAVDDDEELTAWDNADGLRRSLYGQPRRKYISYAALKANAIPCNKRDRSYYTNCASMKQANPYRRSCTAITRCARNML